MTSHILLVCPDDTNARLVKQTGQLALAMKARGIGISILTNARERSVLQSLAKTPVYLSPEVSWLPWRSPLADALRSVLVDDETITAVYVLSLCDSAVALSRVCEKLSVPFIGHAQSTDTLDAEALPFLLRKGYGRMLQQLSHVVVSSATLLEHAQHRGLPRVSYISEGVAVERFKPVLSKRPIRRELDLPESGTLVCCMANIHPDNKQIDVVRACVPLSDFLHIVFVGEIEDMAYMQQLKAEVARFGGDAFVTYREAIENPEDYLRASDVFFLLGGIEERQTTILEAQSAGIPVVLAPSASSLALTNGEKTGVILYPDNAAAKQTVDKLVSDPNFRQGRSIHTRAFVKKHHDVDVMMDSYATLFQNFNA